MKRVFHLYGDNIVECERVFNLIKISLKLTEIKLNGSITNLQIFAKLQDKVFEFIFFPGFGSGRWKQDILIHIKERGGILREAADCIITEVINGSEVVLLAIEFCSALPAGNQAWQRSGRAYSFARSNVPYIYLTEIGGYELDDARNKKAARMPNPAVPFSYVSYSNTRKTPVLIIYQFSPGADNTNKERYKNIIGSSQLLELLHALITNSDWKDIKSSLEEKALSFVGELASSSGLRKVTLSPEEWIDLYNNIQINDNILQCLSALPKIDWKKRVSIELTKSAKRLMDLGTEYGQAITAKDLPINFISKENTKLFLDELTVLYPNISNGIKKMFDGSDSVAICWITGFKPRGDDSRPDRGLLPLLRMLIGEGANVLTVVYGPAKTIMWELLESTPQKLAESNGLWEVIFALSDGLIIDSLTLQKSHISINKEQWISTRMQINTQKQMAVNNLRSPMIYGENDVDSALHILFKYILSDSCFESMCNPPGGDWSGISIVDRNTEYRWLTLPRVTVSNSKRPDHVIQILTTNQLLCIESKDYLQNLEEGIGIKLNQYCSDLLSTMPSCKRDKNCNFEGWDDEVSSYIDPRFDYISASAFIQNRDNELEMGLKKSGCDVIFSLKFTAGSKTIIYIKKGSSKADEIIRLLTSVVIPDTIHLELVIVS